MMSDKKRQVSKTNLAIALVAGGAVAVVGYTLFASQAASPFGSVEAESGTVASGTTVIADTAASASKAIQFAASATTPPVTPPVTPPATSVNLDDPTKKELAMELVSSAENSSLNWKAQYAYIEDIGDGRGYTGGIVGFTSGTHDMLELVQYYKTLAPAAGLLAYLPALVKVDGTASHTGLGTPFVSSWVASAANAAFKAAQDHERDRVYFNPAVAQGKADGLHALGQFIYYDALVMHGPGSDSVSFGGIRANALKKAKTPAQGGNETTYLNAFLDVRKAAMLTEAAHDDTSRVDTEQRVFLSAGNLNLNTPLSWKTYGDPYTIK